MEYNTQLRIDKITKSMVINPDGFGGWMVQNTGATPIVVFGITLNTGEKLDYLTLQPYVRWNTPITITMQGTSEDSAVLHRLIYNSIND